MEHKNLTTTAVDPRQPEQNEQERLPWTRVDWLCVLLICLGSVAALARLWGPGISSEHDMLMGIYRVLELDRAWRQGVLFPRFGLDLNFGYGAPLFQFYSPLASYVALLFHRLGLGLVEAANAVFTISALIVSLGAYVYARWLFRNRLAALVTAGATLLAPYLLTVAYERGAMAEGLALALTPWLFFTAHRLVNEDSPGWMWASSVLVASLVLAHNITALFVTAAVMTYAAILAWRGQRMRRLAHLAGSVALGLGLSAFYWMPALAETRFTQMGATMFSGIYSAIDNLTPWHDLIQSTVIFDFWGPLRFRLALWQAVLGGIALLLLPFQAPRVRLSLGLVAAIGLVALALQLTLARPFWELVPLVRSIQFPWRLLGLISFCVAMLVGSIFLLRPLQGRTGVLAAVVLLLGILVIGQRGLQADLANPRYPIASSQIGLNDLFQRGVRGFSLFSDFQPEAQQVPSTALALPRPSDAAEQAPLTAKPTLQVLDEKPFYFRFRVQSDEPFPLRLHRIFFPGWQAAIDGDRLRVEPAGQTGLVSIQVPAGEHEVAIRYAGTPLQQFAAVISIISLVTLIVLLARTRSGRIALGVASGLALATVVLVVLTQGRSELARRPQPVEASFAHEIRLLGYALPQRSWQPGDTLPLRLYWFAQQPPLGDYRVLAYLESQDGSGKVARIDSGPILGYGVTSRWEPGEVVVDQQNLQLNPATAPGTYRLVVGLYRPDTMQHLAVSDAPTALPGNLVSLGEVEIGAR